MTQLPLILRGKALAKILQDKDLHDDKLIIVDLGKPAIYEQAHLPGALHLDYRRLQKGELPAPGLLPELEDIAQLLSALGITPITHVVAYDDEGGTHAARLLWLLDAIGHAHYSFLDGGIHAWLADDLPYETEASEAKKSHYSSDLFHVKKQIDRVYLLTHYRAENIQIWDARTAEEFSGARVMAQRGGHIPGAINYNWELAIDRNNDNRLRDLEIIRAELAAAGITGTQKIITHCQTHHRSSFTWLLGKALGFDIAGYPGAWAEWGNHPDTPIAHD